MAELRCAGLAEDALGRDQRAAVSPRCTRAVRVTALQSIGHRAEVVEGAAAAGPGRPALSWRAHNK